MIPTDDVLSEDALRDFLFPPDPDADDVDDMGTVIAVCAGEWRKERDGRWRAWTLDD